MPDRQTRLPTRRIALGVVQLVGPILLLLAIVVWQAELDPLRALLLGVLFTAWYALVARRHSRALYALRDYSDRMIAEEGPIPTLAKTASPAVRDLAQAISRLARAHHARDSETRRLLAARAAILDAVPEAVFAFDGTARIVMANRAAVDLFPNCVGLDLTGVFRQPEVVAAVQSVLQGTRRATGQLTLTAPVERSYAVGVSRLGTIAPDGTQGVMTLHDMTAVRRAEQTRTDFVANASHEIRTPLTSLLGFIETLQGPAKDDPKAQEMFLGIMRDQAERMRRLVGDLLSLSRIEQHEHELPTAPLVLADVIRRTVLALQPIAAAKGVTLELDLEADLEIRGDADEMAQLAQNLIDNAIKYGRINGRVMVRVAQDGGRVLFSVQDDGEGIARDHLPRLTERFYRVDPARSRSAGGTGLGLAIVKHIVSRHRGRLAIDSEVGRGTVFTVHLPPA